VIRRIRVHEDIYGPMVNPDSGPGRYFTDEEIRERIGMTTNATRFTVRKFNADADARRRESQALKAKAEKYQSGQEKKEG